jgi:cysteine desulfurase
MIYLDNAATTEMDDAVLVSMIPYLTWNYGNAGSLHSMGREAYNAVWHAREQVAKFINASPEQIIFTSGGSEANNMVIHNAYKFPMYNRIISTKAEHDSILNYLKKIKSWEEGEFKIDLLHINEFGVIDISELEELISRSRGVQLISVMHTNNELGSVNPIEKVGEVCLEHAIQFHTDCVQAAGFSKLDVQKLQCDYLSLSSHKIHGPKGVGALFVRKPGFFTEFIFGGKSQEFGFRGGTENVAGIVGFGTACELADERLADNVNKILSCHLALSETLENGLEDFGISEKIHYNSPCPGKVLNIRFDGIRSETLLMALDSQGVSVSAGSACNASDGKPSHVLKAIGLTDEEARSSIRVSFSKMNTPEECFEAGKIVADTVKMLLEI